MESGGNIVKLERNEREPRPEDVRLENGDPLYYLLLDVDDGGAGVISPMASQEAHEHLRKLFATDPEAVLSCEGKSPAEAKEILNAIVETGLGKAA